MSLKTAPTVTFSTPGLGSSTTSTNARNEAARADDGRSCWVIVADQDRQSARHDSRALHLRRVHTLPTCAANRAHRQRLTCGAQRRMRAAWCATAITSCSGTTLNPVVCCLVGGLRGAIILVVAVGGRRYVCCEEFDRRRWFQRRAERASRRFVTRSCVERCCLLRAVSGGVRL